MNEEIKRLVQELDRMDCGDNSCPFAKDKKGMRTNGGCRCLKSLPFRLRHAITSLWVKYKGDVENGNR